MSEAEIKEEISIENDKNERIYELGYLLAPTIEEVDLPVIFGDLKELVSFFGGIHISDEMPKMMPLSYAMVKVVSNARHKFNTAYFGWIKFELATDSILELKKKLDSGSEFHQIFDFKNSQGKHYCGQKIRARGYGVSQTKSEKE